MIFAKQKMIDLREAKGISQQDLADAIGVSRVTIINWETGKFSPRLEDIGKVGEALGVPGKFFIGDSE